MASIQVDPAPGRRRTGFSRLMKRHIRIDMTPMVDLGFLLITFFIFTTSLLAPKATTLIMPNDTPTPNPTNLPESLALTFLIDERNKVYYYHGNWDDAIQRKEIHETNFSYAAGIGKVIREKQVRIDRSGTFAEGRKGLMLVIKPGANSSYKNVIDMLDEVMINDVKKYAIVDLSVDENSWLKSQKAAL